MKRTIQKRTFTYIDAMPGAGKTEYFVEHAVAMLRSKSSEHSMLYVAPTVALLVEAYIRITAHQKFRDPLNQKITMVATPDTIRSKSGGLDINIIDEKPKKVLNYLLGLSERCGSLDTLPAQLQPGNLILTTHESFVQVADVDKSGNDFHILRHTKVIFDEARHCVIDSRVMSDVNNEHFLNIRRSFSFSRVDGVIDKASPWRAYEISSAPTKEQLTTEFRTQTWLGVPKAVRELRKTVDAYSDSGRASVYMMTNVDPYNLLLDEERKTRINVYTLLRPTGLFNHYRSVILTSAFFKDSQMYHFLKADGHKFRNAKLKAGEDSILASIYERDRELRRALPERLRVGVLLRTRKLDTGQSAYRNNLTSMFLQSGMAIPVGLMNDFLKEHLDKNLTSEKILDRLSRGQLVTKNSKLQASLLECCHPPLWILIRESARLVQLAQETEIIKKEENKFALLVLNVSQKTWSGRKIPFASVVRTLHTVGTLNPKGGGDLDSMHTTFEEHRLRSTSPYWQRELAKQLYVRSKERKFFIPQSNKLHGINLYSGVNAFVHLAALNPAPQLISFYKMLLGPAYDIDQDHSIENLVQMLYRTSLRVVGNKDPVLMIVPYKAQAELLQTKIGTRPFTYINKPRLTPWSYRREIPREQVLASLKKANLASQAVRNIQLPDDDYKAMRSLQASRSRYRRFLSAEPDSKNSKKWEQAIKDCDAQILQFRKVGRANAKTQNTEK